MANNPYGVDMDEVNDKLLDIYRNSDPRNKPSPQEVIVYTPKEYKQKQQHEATRRGNAYLIALAFIMFLVMLVAMAAH